MKNKSYLPLLVALTTWLSLQFMGGQAKFFYFLILVVPLFIFLSVKYITSKKIFSSLVLFLPPGLFFLSFVAYTVIISRNFWIQFIYLLITWFIFFYFRNLYYFFHEGSDRQLWAFKFNNLLRASGFLTVFAASAFLFDLPTFLNWPFYYLLLFSTGINFLMLWQFTFFTKDGIYQQIKVLFISTLVLAEMMLVISLLPFNFNILALLLALFYAFILLMLKLLDHNNLNKKIIKWSFILFILIFIVLLLTARWL